MLLIPLVVAVVGLAILAYEENPACEYNRQINRLVRESVRKEKRRARMPKRGYAYAQVGWTEHD